MTQSGIKEIDESERERSLLHLRLVFFLLSLFLAVTSLLDSKIFLVIFLTVWKTFIYRTRCYTKSMCIFLKESSGKKRRRIIMWFHKKKYFQAGNINTVKTLYYAGQKINLASRVSWMKYLNYIFSSSLYFPSSTLQKNI